MMKRSFPLVGLFLSILAGPAFALDGVRVGDCWTDENGVNHCGESSSSYSSSSSSYGYQYTYGYTDPVSASNEAAARAQRIEARRQRQEELAWQRVQQQAVNLNETGNQYFSKGDYDNAVRFYQQAHNTDPSDPVILNNLNMARGSQWNEAGNRYWGQSDWVNAVSAYEQALALKPESSVIRESLESAREYLRAQQETQAADARMKAQLSEAGVKIKEQLSNVKISAPAPTQSSTMSFKTGKETSPALSAPSAIATQSKSVFEQLKNAWKSGLKAKEAPTDESASARARLGFDTQKGVQNVDAVDSSVVDLRGMNAEKLTPTLQFKSFKNQTASKPKATQVPEFDPTLPLTPIASTNAVAAQKPKATQVPEFDPTLPLTPVASPDKKMEDELINIMLNEDEMKFDPFLGHDSIDSKGDKK